MNRQNAIVGAVVGAAGMCAYYYYNQNKKLVNSLFQQKPTADQVVFENITEMIPGREVKAKLLDSTVGLGAEWQKVRDSLKSEYPDNKFQDPSRMPAHVTIMGQEEFDVLRGDEPLPANSDEWAKYVPPLAVKNRVLEQVYSLQNTHPTYAVNVGKKSVGVKFGDQEQYHTTFAFYKEGVPENVSDFVSKLLTEDGFSLR